MESLAKSGVAECILVTGYLSDQVRGHFGRGFRGVEISYVQNERYDETNNLYSLWLALKEFDDDMILLEGDLIFEDALLEQLLTSPDPSVAVVDRYQPFMDGTVILPEGRLSKAMVLKKDQEADFDYSRALKTVNIYKLSGMDLSHQIIPELSRYVVEGKTDQYYEAIFADLISRGVFELSVLHTEAVKWAEIDTIDDLELAEKFFPAMAVPGG
jgi:choline kinase